MITAVSACPRPAPGDEYLQRTVESLFAAGARDVYYYDDVCKLGSGLSMIELVKELHAQFPGEDVLLLEDDVVACKNAIAAVERLTFPPNCQVLNCFLERSHTLQFKGYQIRMVPSRDGFVYAQAVKLHSDMVRRIAETAFVPDDFGPGNQFWYLREATLWHYFRQAGGFIAYLWPSWFEHIGEMSAISGMRNYKPHAHNWKGIEHDALIDDVSTILYT